MYYEKFTECLNELLIHYQPKVNAAGEADSNYPINWKKAVVI
jgi:hypothetical protein